MIIRNDKTISFKNIFLDEFSVKFIFSFLALINLIPFAGNYIGPLMKVCLAWGTIVLLYQAKINWKNLFLNKRIFLLIAYLVLYGVSILINHSVMFSKNFSEWCYMALFFLLFTQCDPRKGERTIIHEIQLLLYLLIGVSFLFAVISFYTFANQISYAFQNPELKSDIIYFGMAKDRLWGLSNPNVGGMLACFSIAASLWILLTKSNQSRKHPKGWAAFFIINIILQYACLTLMQSRASLITFSIFVGPFVGFWYFTKSNKAHKYRSLKFKAAVVCVVFLLLPVVLEKPVRNTLSLIPKTVSSVRIASQEAEKKTESVEVSSQTTESSTSGQSSNTGANGNFQAERNDTTLESRGGILNGRLDLWQAGLKVFSQHPFFGVTREGIYQYSMPYITLNWLESSLHGAGLHNGYLMVLVSSGIFGFVILGIYIISVLGTLFKKIRRSDGFIKLLLSFFLILMIAILVHEMVESHIMYRVTYFVVFFWSMVGYALTIASRVKEREISDSSKSKLSQ
ncbi:O-antigen ligase family protein [Caproicibacterium sp. BJN0003]|uniref:O-antigen ligase family protein n=1 Tax=Caproicibacterium sp. BJN0003 TaxID=2994078 RepID=UPI0022574827|nr:O-antigen ligase family protein [Caproicibacterium sp. BJN0003]UZT81245.1 O-antigen ligase family protein [Caproicibacterium sp. BJN0003]